MFSNVQCGCRRNRSTVDHLVRLESEVRKIFALKEHMVSVFFDLEKAYDTMWRYGILRDMYAAGLRGCLPKYVQEFLSERKFKVRVRSILSDTQVQTNGVPQGSILSVTLFALKINSIASVVPQNPRFLTSLYVDGLLIGFRHCNLNIIKYEMQQCLSKLNQWTKENKFKFPGTNKSNAFYDSSRPTPKTTASYRK